MNIRCSWNSHWVWWSELVVSPSQQHHTEPHTAPDGSTATQSSESIAREWHTHD